MVTCATSKPNGITNGRFLAYADCLQFIGIKCICFDLTVIKCLAPVDLIDPLPRASPTELQGVPQPSDRRSVFVFTGLRLIPPHSSKHPPVGASQRRPRRA